MNKVKGYRRVTNQTNNAIKWLRINHFHKVIPPFLAKSHRHLISENWLMLKISSTSPLMPNKMGFYGVLRDTLFDDSLCHSVDRFLVQHLAHVELWLFTLHRASREDFSFISWLTSGWKARFFLPPLPKTPTPPN